MTNEHQLQLLRLETSVTSQLVLVLAHQGVELLVFMFAALLYKLPLLLLQLLQLPLQAVQVKRSSVPQQASRERVHV